MKTLGIQPKAKKGACAYYGPDAVAKVKKRWPEPGPTVALLASTFASGSEAASLVRLQGLYDHHRYLDAFALTQRHWSRPRTSGACRSTNCSSPAGWRSAGGPRLSRWLLRQAATREPANPCVRLHTDHLWLRGQRRLEALRPRTAARRRSRRCPIQGGLARQPGVDLGVLARFRACPPLSRRRACAFCRGRMGVRVRSGILGLEDRWADALTPAKQAWDLDPGSPFASIAIGTCLLNLGGSRSPPPGPGRRLAKVNPGSLCSTPLAPLRPRGDARRPRTGSGSRQGDPARRPAAAPGSPGGQGVTDVLARASTRYRLVVERRQPDRALGPTRFRSPFIAS